MLKYVAVAPCLLGYVSRQRHPTEPAQQPEVVVNRERRPLREVGCECESHFQQPVWLCQAIDEADLIEPFRREPTAGRQFGSNCVGEVLTREQQLIAGDVTAYDLSDLEQRGWYGDAKVSAGGEEEATSQGIPIDRRDCRFLQLLKPEGIAHRNLWQPQPWLTAGKTFLDIHTGAKRVSPPREDSHPGLVVGSEALPALGQAKKQVVPHSIMALGPVHGDDDNGSSLLVLYDSHFTLL